MRAGAPDLSQPDTVTPLLFAVPVTRSQGGNGTLIIGSSANAVEVANVGFGQSIRVWALGDRDGAALPIASGSLTFSSSSNADAMEPDVKPWLTTTPVPGVFDGREFAILSRATKPTAVESPMAGFVVGVFTAEPVESTLRSVEVKVKIVQKWAAIKTPINEWPWKWDGTYGGVNENSAANPGENPGTLGIQLDYNWYLSRDGFPDEFSGGIVEGAGGTSNAQMAARFPQRVSATILPKNTTLVQQHTTMVESVGGATWPLIHDGHWRTRSLDELTGSAPVKTVAVADGVEDLGWKIDPSTRMDGVQFTFKELTWRQMYEDSNDSFTLDEVHVTPYAERFWLDVPITGPLHGGFRGHLNGQPDGSGGDILVRPIGIRTRALNVWDFEWTNVGNNYLVTPTGDPGGALCELWRGVWTDTTVSAGSVTTSRLFTRTLDWPCQSKSVAQQLANRVLGLVTRAGWYCQRLRVVPDLNLELGDTIRLTHTDGLDVRALIVGINLSLSAGNFVQELDLVVLPTAGIDFDAWADANLPNGAAATLANFDTWADANLPGGAAATIADFDAYLTNH